MKKLRDHGLSIVLACCFLVFWAFQSWAGYLVHTKTLTEHGRPAGGYFQYLGSGHFWQATAENWESEFLQMGVYVFLGSFLFQRGSAESKDPDKAEEGDEPVDKHLHDDGAPAILRKGRALRWLYCYSLSIAFLVLCTVACLIHAWSGYVEQREEAGIHGQEADSFWQFVTGAEFWFQAMQNWQSEFLAVLSIVLLSIWLRHHGSPESKKVWDSHQSTGKA
jgi:hypothetical protein